MLNGFCSNPLVFTASAHFLTNEVRSQFFFFWHWSLKREDPNFGGSFPLGLLWVLASLVCRFRSKAKNRCQHAGESQQGRPRRQPIWGASLPGQMLSWARPTFHIRHRSPALGRTPGGCQKGGEGCGNYKMPSSEVKSILSPNL